MFRFIERSVRPNHHARGAHGAQEGWSFQPPGVDGLGAGLGILLTFATQAILKEVNPGLMILMAVLAFNLMGDGLRDALDPKLKR